MDEWEGFVTHNNEYFVTTFDIEDLWAWWKERHCPIWDEREDFDDVRSNQAHLQLQHTIY
jgi:hypothetical protein